MRSNLLLYHLANRKCTFLDISINIHSLRYALVGAAAAEIISISALLKDFFLFHAFQVRVAHLDWLHVISSEQDKTLRMMMMIILYVAELH